ncbi:MAG TPA: phospholipase D-like domain-containing protein [Phycisphaerae bacterium]|nr:phospholipase D-like domain-containing protein [Phycisphaerae bacterium]
MENSRPIDGPDAHLEKWTPAERIEVAGHTLELFTEAPPLFSAMLEDINAAQKRVWLETYIFADDASGVSIAEALKRRAARGVDVRVLYDAVGSQKTSSAFFRDLAAAGVKVHAYHNFREALRKILVFIILNRRNHRKLLIVDNRSAYFGGMNIIDYGRDLRFLNVDDSEESHLGRRDVHVRLRGPQQEEVARSFERSWRHALGLPLERLPKDSRRVKLRDEQESIHFFDSGPRVKFGRATRVYRTLLNMGRRNVIIAMAYFIPYGAVMRSILAARRRGVRVDVVVPALSDIKIAQYATWYLYNKLLRRGVRIYERKDRMLHSKVVVIDRQWAVVGSANMDPRSLRINLEFLAVIRSHHFADALRRICRHEIRRSRRVRLAEVEHRTLKEKILSRICFALRWWL